MSEKAGKKETGEEERKRSTDLIGAACCPFSVVQRATRQKMVCIGELPEVTGTSGKPTAILT